MREALTASAGGARQRFDNAVEDIARRGDDFANETMNLTLAVSAIAFYILHGQEWPGPERVDLLVQKFTENETWADIEPQVVKDYLDSLGQESGSPLDRIPLGKFVPAVFAITGWLLSAFPLPEGVAWNDFLDEIEDEIEARS
ncbi:hypothetical protein [Kineosporia sp. NBRC 101677]|uniref:hypothetical protein n=1 Tax=Kineosporia sp. NBRC 101677 TaxID=3032197 RepID=UPI0025564221|nr:hypothetical protein [Kineosporia sp. NBRC 101677]